MEGACQEVVRYKWNGGKGRRWNEKKSGEYFERLLYVNTKLTVIYCLLRLGVKRVDLEFRLGHLMYTGNGVRNLKPGGKLVL